LYIAACNSIIKAENRMFCVGIKPICHGFEHIGELSNSFDMTHLVL